MISHRKMRACVLAVALLALCAPEDACGREKVKPKRPEPQGTPVLRRITRSRNDPEGYRHDRFIEDVRDAGCVNCEFEGKNTSLFKDVRVEDARRFRAANYMPEESWLLRGAVRARIDQLVNLPRSSSGGLR